MIRLFIADDHTIVREGVKAILHKEPDMRVEGEADNGKDALQRILNETWDVVLLDVSMPRLDGLEVLKRVREVKPKLPILILTMHAEEMLAVRFLKAGASGYLTKESVPEQLIGAIRKVVQGKKYLSLQMAEQMADHLGCDPETPSHTLLSDREFAVLRKIAAGHTMAQIADALHLSPSTVSTYRSRILTKMNLTNNAELTHYAIKNGLVD